MLHQFGTSLYIIFHSQSLVAVVVNDVHCMAGNWPTMEYIYDDNNVVAPGWPHKQ